MDYRNTLLSDSNTVIYGHNMKNKTMFSQLENFKEEDFFNENNKIRITLKDKVYIYEVFSAYYTEPSYNYIFLNFKSKDEHNHYIDNAVKKSIYKSNVNVDCNDRIITLSTCSYELKDTRTVVHAKLNSIKNKE
jgi:sortase B